jgi:hypothetical protein
MSNPYFINFGCWNRGGCIERGDNDLSKVMTLLNSTVERQPPECIIISGDNYYPPKIKVDKKKKKYFIKEDLESGFRCLPKEVPIYINYGNHDYETDLFIKLQSRTPLDLELKPSSEPVSESATESELKPSAEPALEPVSEVRENDCTLTKSEINLVQELNSEGYNINLDLHREINFGENTIIITIDTTIYDDDDIGEYLQCYKPIFGDDLTIEKIKELQLRFIAYVIDKIQKNEQITNIIVVGHHPLMSYKIKEKDGVEKLKLFNLNNLLNFLYNGLLLQLNSLHREFNYYYLCADLHQYQVGTIVLTDKNDGKTFNIKQFIVGTGGAEKDAYNSDLIRSYKHSSPDYEGDTFIANYIMNEENISESRAENGILICEQMDRDLIFRFLPISLIGGKRKTKKNRKIRRTKKIKNKKMKHSKRKTKKNLYHY